jgi:hypothetical protein
MKTLKNLTAEDLQNMSLIDLVSICKALDSNGDWSDVNEIEYDYILETAKALLFEFQN